MTHLQPGRIYCMKYCNFRIISESFECEVTQCMTLPADLLKPLPSMHKTIADRYTHSLGRTINELMRRANDVKIIPYIYHEIVVIGYAGACIYFKFDVNAAASRIQRMVNDIVTTMEYHQGKTEVELGETSAAETISTGEFSYVDIFAPQINMANITQNKFTDTFIEDMRARFDTEIDLDAVLAQAKWERQFT